MKSRSKEAIQYGDRSVWYPRRTTIFNPNSETLSKKKTHKTRHWMHIVLAMHAGILSLYAFISLFPTSFIRFNILYKQVSRWQGNLPSRNFTAQTFYVLELRSCRYHSMCRLSKGQLFYVVEYIQHIEEADMFQWSILTSTMYIII